MLSLMHHKFDAAVAIKEQLLMLLRVGVTGVVGRRGEMGRAVHGNSGVGLLLVATYKDSPGRNIVIRS